MDKREMSRKGELTWDTMIPWIIAITALVVVTIFAFLLKDKLIAMGGYIRNLFR